MSPEQSIIVTAAYSQYPVLQGLDICIEFMEREAYLDTVLIKMRNIEPIDTGLFEYRYRSRRVNSAVTIECAVMVWSNGIILVSRPKGTDNITYLCYTNPDKVKFNAQKEQGKRQQAQPAEEIPT